MGTYQHLFRPAPLSPIGSYNCFSTISRRLGYQQSREHPSSPGLEGRSKPSWPSDSSPPTSGIGRRHVQRLISSTSLAGGRRVLGVPTSADTLPEMSAPYHPPLKIC